MTHTTHATTSHKGANDLTELEMLLDSPSVEDSEYDTFQVHAESLLRAEHHRNRQLREARRAY